MDNLDDIIEDAAEGVTTLEWANRLRVAPEIVRSSRENGNVMFLRTEMVAKLQGNPFNLAKKRDARRSYIVNEEAIEELPLLVVSATSNFAYLSEGNHRLWAWKSLRRKWFPVKVSLSWSAKPLKGWQTQRRTRGFLTLFNTNTAGLPLRNMGYDSYTPNSATPRMMRRVYGLEVLDWNAPPTTFSDVPDQLADAFDNALLMRACDPADLTCVVCSMPADNVCGGCNFELYCGDKCQKQHFETHRDECWID